MSPTVPRLPPRQPLPATRPATRPARAAAGWHRPEPLGLLLLVAAALLVRLHGIGGKPYWMDEITTLRRASLPLGPLVRDSLSFHHLPLYFVVSSWLVPFGLQEGVMRLPAALFGAASCAVLFLIGRSLGNWRSGLAAGLLLALAPVQVQYGQEARSYTLVTTLILVALWGLVLLARDPAAAAAPLRRRGPARRAWLLYGIGTALALNTLGVALFWLLAANVSAIPIAWRAPDGWRGFARNWLAVQLLVLAAFLPFLAAMAVLTRGDMGSGLDWVPPLRAHNVWVTLQAVYLMRISSLIAFRIFPSPVDLLGVCWLGWIVALLALAGLWAMRRRGATGAVAAVSLLTLPVALGLGSVLFPMWMPRYLLWSGPVFFLLAGCGLLALPARAQVPVLLGLALLGAANLAPYYDTETKPLWNQAASRILQDRRPGDLLVTDDPGTIDMMNVYLRRVGRPLSPQDWTTDVDVASARRVAGGRIVAVHGTVGQNDPYRQDAFLDALAPLGQVSAVYRVGIDITMFVFPPVS